MNMVRIARKSESYIYTLSESTVISEDFGKVTVYGISISDKFQKAHLENVVEDFLSDGCPKIISFPKKSDGPLPVA